MVNASPAYSSHQGNKNMKYYGERFSVTATGTTSATATKTASSGHSHYITDISASSDKAGAVILVKNGTTVIWAAIVDANASYNHTFGVPLKGTAGNLVSVEIDGTSVCKANIAGYTI